MSHHLGLLRLCPTCSTPWTYHKFRADCATCEAARRELHPEWAPRRMPFRVCSALEVDFLNPNSWGEQVRKFVGGS